jgi:hypothetical protein
MSLREPDAGSIWLSLCTGSATGSAAVSKAARWGFESLPVCQLSECSLPGGMAYALRSERSVLVTSRFESGGRDQDLRGRGEKGRRGPKTLSVGPAEKATQVNEQRPTVADAPNGYLSGSLGKRVSKPMLSSSNDRSSANCRFESCRPHQIVSIDCSRSWRNWNTRCSQSAVSS